jgi:hypothetical protein
MPKGWVAATFVAAVLALASGDAAAQSLGRASAGFGARAGSTSSAFAPAQTTGTTGSINSVIGGNLVPSLSGITQGLASTQLSTGINVPLRTAPTFLSILGAASSAATGLPTGLSNQ